MTGSKSFPMDSTLTHSFHDLNPPLISFVGRPGDSRKGLQLFLDAVSCLLSLEDVPRFSVWIIGGAAEEVVVTKALVECRPLLRQALAYGQIVIWGRVETESLPDLYARSFLVVMPSKWEQFGLVALEAMACGTPVVAMNIGGLTDIVIDGYTGVLITDSDSALLANTISAYLRDPQRRHFHGAAAASWVSFGFARERTYSSFVDAYATDAAQTDSGFPSAVKQRAILLDQIKPRLSQLIGEDVLETNDYSTGHNVCFEIVTQQKSFFGKWFPAAPTRSPSVLPLPYFLRAPRSPTELVARYKFNTGNAATPQLKAVSDDDSLIITEWCERAVFPSAIEERTAIRCVAAEFHAFAHPRPGPILTQYERALGRVIHEPEVANILEFDQVAARLNSELTGGVLRFGHSHPHIELLRYRKLMEQKTWALPERFHIRAAAAIEYALSQGDAFGLSPLLCHGSLEARHLLLSGGRVVACDLDSCRFAVGPMDEAHYVFSRITHKQAGPIAAIRELREITSKPEFPMASAWLIVYLLFEGLYAITHGKSTGLDVFVDFTDAYFSNLYLLSDDIAQ
jgi:Glycosyl transferases group 1